MENFVESKNCFEKAIELSPSQSSWKNWITKCNQHIKETNIPPNNKIENNNENNSTTGENRPTITSTKIRQEWYQTSTHVIITFFAKNIPKENVKVEIKQQSVKKFFFFFRILLILKQKKIKKVGVTIKLEEGREYVNEMKLLAKIVVDKSSFIHFSTKIEVKLKKESDAHWDSLEWKENSNLRTYENTGSSSSNPPSYPSSSKKKVNWDKLEIDEDEVHGEDALNKVFKDIYKNGNEEQRRAMMKSFQESGGTVLSTNWDEVKQKKVEGSPPDGLLMKNWKDL